MLSMTVFIVYELQIWPKVDHNAQYLGCDIHQYIVHTPYYSVVRDRLIWNLRVRDDFRPIQ